MRSLGACSSIALARPRRRGGQRQARREGPRFVRNIPTGETGWFSSPGLVDLDGDRRLEIVAPFYSHVRVRRRGAAARQGHGDERAGLRARAWSPTSTATATREIVVGGNDGTVAAYSLAGGRLQLEPGWPASTCSGGQCPETRGMAAADLDGDGRIEVVVTTTNTSPTGSQVFVFDASGAPYRPAGAPATAWPRYNTLSGPATTPASTASATTATGPTARTSGSASSTTTRSWRSSSRSTTTRSTSSTTTARRCSPRRGTRTGRATTPARGSAGGSSSAG